MTHPLRSLFRRLTPITAVLAAVVTLFVAACGDDIQPITQPKGPMLAVGYAEGGTNPGATVETDYDDYVPGQTVHVTLRGWAANEDVELILTEDPATHDPVKKTVAVNESGYWYGDLYDVGEHDLGVTFTLTATGLVSQSVATAKFTDGSIKVAGAPSGVAFTLTAVGYSNSTCTNDANSLNPSLTAGVWNVGTGSSAYVKLTVSDPATSGGGAFVNWTNPDATTSSSNPYCVPTPSGTVTYTANYAAVSTGSITIIKDADPNDAQDFSFTASGAGLSNFSLDDDADPTLSNTQTFTGLANGAGRLITEGTVSGWTITNISCSGATTSTINIGASGGFDQNDNSVTIDLAGGESITCTFTNTKNASLAIQKQTVTTTGTFDFVGTGFPVPASFSRNTGTANPTSEAAWTILPTAFGDKYVQETVPTGWVLTGISCTASGASYVIGRGGSGAFVNGGSDGFDAGDNTVKVTVGAGNTPTCTFTNTEVASLAIQKQSVGGEGTFDFVGTGSLVPTSFSRTTTTTTNPTDETPWGILPSDFGDKYVQETIPAGWVLTGINCTANGATYVIGRGGSGAFVNGGTDGFDAGDNTVKVTVGAGNTPTCTFTNSRKPELEVKKALDPSTDDGKFDFTVDGTAYDNGGAGYGHNGSTGAIVFNTEKTVSFSEAAHAGTTLSQYVSELSCTKSTATNTNTAGSVALVYGDKVVCTFTNHRKPELKVAKVTVPTSDPGKFDFTVGGTTYDKAGAGYGNGEATDFLTLGVGDVAISEAAHTGTTLSQYDAVLACNSGKTVDPNGGTSGTVKDLAYGDKVTCTFTNTKKAVLLVDKVTKPAGDAAEFTFTPTNWNGGSTFKLADATAPKSSGYVSPGTYSVSEGTLTGWGLSDRSCVFTGGTTAHSFTKPDASSIQVVLGAGEEVTCTFSNTAPASVTLTDPDATQYSDKVLLKASVTSVATVASPTGYVKFHVTGPGGFSYDTPDPGIALDANGKAEERVRITGLPGTGTAYAVTAEYLGDSNFDGATSSAQNFDVEKENAEGFTVSNPGSAQLGAKTFTVEVGIKEALLGNGFEPDTNAGQAYGDISKVTSLTAVAAPFSSGGGNVSGSCVPGGVLGGPAYNEYRKFTCTFGDGLTSLPVDVFTLTFTVGADYYTGSYEDVFSIWDPGAGFATGGGWFLYDGDTGDRTSFGFSFTQTKGKTSVRGGLVVIRHLAGGGVCRAKSNSMNAPSVSGNVATLAGKGNYNCVIGGVTTISQGNLNIYAVAEDWATSGAGADKFRVQAMDQLNLAILRTLKGGNIQVPQPQKKP